MVNDKIYQAIAANSDKLGTFGHGYTYSGHPVAAAVALETLRVIEDDRIVERRRDQAPAFAAALRQHVGRKHVGDVRAVGLMGALEFVVDKDSWGGFPVDAKRASPLPSMRSTKASSSARLAIRWRCVLR